MKRPKLPPLLAQPAFRELRHYLAAAVEVSPDRPVLIDKFLENAIEVEADAIARRDGLLRESAAELRAVSDQRAYGEKALRIWALRLLIGLFLVFQWRHMHALAASATEAGEAAVRNIPLEHFTSIAQAVGLTSMTMTGAALLMILLVFILGNGENTRLRAAGRTAGEQLADAAKAFDAELEDHRAIITDTSKSVADILPAVSQAHLSALAAKLFFRRIAFLTESESTETNRFSNADSQFSRFLAMGYVGGAGVSLGLLLFWVTVSYFVGAGSMLLVLKMLKGGGGALMTNAAALAGYGEAWEPLLAGFGLYAIAGMAVSLVLDEKGALADDVLVEGVGVVDEEETGPEDVGLAEDIEEAVLDLPATKRHDDEAVMLAVKRAARAYFDDVWGKRPVIVTHIHRTSP